MSDKPSDGSNKTAPYTSFRSVKTMIAGLKKHGIPNRIDRSVLTSFSNAVGSQIMTALRFLELTDDGGRPTDSMKKLVEVYGSDEWVSELEAILRAAYGPLFTIDLEKASPKEFGDHFRDSYSGTEDVRRKSETFFLNAVRDTSIKISAYILKKQKPRTLGNSTAKKTTGCATRRKKNSVQPTTEDDNSGERLADDYRTLIRILDPDKMSENEREAVFTLISFLKKQKAKAV